MEAVGHYGGTLRRDPAFDLAQRVQAMLDECALYKDREGNKRKLVPLEHALLLTIALRVHVVSLGKKAGGFLVNKVSGRP